MKQRIKLDFNELAAQIGEVIEKGKRSKIVKKNADGIAVGMYLLSEYLIEIGELAVKQENAELIEILLDLHVLSEVNTNDERTQRSV